MRRPSLLLAAAASTLVVLLLLVPTTQAWNPVKSIVKGVKRVGEFVGGVVGAPVGGFVGAATAPTIRNAEASAMRITADIDERMSNRLNQLDQVMANTIVKVDASMHDRILQLDAAAKERIAQMDKVLQVRIEQVDEVLKARTDQIGEIVTTAVNDVDRSLKNRIEQLDQVAETRLGTLDVIASKTSLGLEQSFIRVVGAGCLLVFVTFLIWALYRRVVRYWQKQGTQGGVLIALGGVARSSELRKGILLETGVAALALLVLFIIVNRMPGSASQRQQELASVYQNAFDTAYVSFDLDRARFLAAQLQAIAPTDVANRARFLRTELIRDVLNRPALIQTLEGLNELTSRVSQLDTYSTGNDADVLALKAYVLWQVAADREDEYEAVKLAADSLEASEREGFSKSLLVPVITSYVRAFASAPPPQCSEADLERFTKLAKVAAKYVDEDLREGFAALAHIRIYDVASQKLDFAIGDSYHQMLEAHASIVNLRGRAPAETALAAAFAKRTRHAQYVLDAFEEFDTTLRSSPFLQGTTIPLAAFGQNDAIWVTAQWFVLNAETDKLPPLFMVTTTDIGAGSESEFLVPAAPARSATLSSIAPLRLKWRTRYQNLLGEVARDVVDAEEAERFRRFELLTRQMEYDLVKYLSADRNNSFNVLSLGRKACNSVASLGLYVRDAGDGEVRISLAQRIFNELTDPQRSILAPPVREEFERDAGEDGKAYLEEHYKVELGRRRGNIL